MIKDFNERTNTLLYKNISLTLYSRKGWCFYGVWEMGGETYILRKGTSSHIFFHEPAGANAWTLLQAETFLIGCVFRAPRWFSVLCQKLTTWFSSCDLLPVTHLLYPSALIALLFTNHNVTACQRTRGHQERTENPCHMLYKIRRLNTCVK